MSLMAPASTVQQRRLEGKVALITGGNVGLGRALALAFGREGADLCLMARSADSLEETAQDVESLGRSTLAIAGDVSREADVVRAVEATLERFGRIDILVNNAGIGGPMAPAIETELEGWYEVIHVNLTGAFLCAREAMKHMINRRQGVILNIGSIFGKRGYPLRIAYAVSKAGLISLTQTLALEGGKYGVRVNCICPGPIQGDRIDRVWRLRSQVTGVPYEVIRDKMIRMAALRRIPVAEEIAAAAVFLASDEASAITGQAINVDAGTEMR